MQKLRHPIPIVSYYLKLLPPWGFQFSDFHNFFILNTSFFPRRWAFFKDQELQVLPSLPWFIFLGTLETFPYKNVQIYIYTQILV